MESKKHSDRAATPKPVEILWSTAYQLLLLLREPVGVAFGAIFAIVIVPLFGALYGHHPTVVAGVYHKNVIAWDAIGINLAASAFITIPTNFSAQRSYGVLKLFRASPLSRVHLVLSFLFANMIFFLLFVILLLLTNAILYGLYFPSSPYSLLTLGIGLTLGSIAMIPTGMVIAAMVRSHTAVAPCGQLLFIPNLLLSGLSIPLDESPMLIQHVSQSLPLTHVGILLTTAWTGGTISEIESATWWVLSSYGALSILMICFFLRWE